jgi:hypothetical protein
VSVARLQICVSVFHSCKYKRLEGVLCKVHQLTSLNLLSIREVLNLVVGGKTTMMEILDLIYSRIVEVCKVYKEDL